MKVYGVIIFVICAFSPIFAQGNQTFTGTCPIVTTKAAFNETKFAGRWYEIKRYVNDLITGECGLPNYVAAEKGGYNVTFLTTTLSDKSNSTTSLELKRPTGSTPGDYDVYVNSKIEKIRQRILETDYETYGIVWGCTYNATNNLNTQRLSIYSRTNTLNDTMIAQVMKILSDANIKNATLVNVEQDHKKCGRNTATALVMPTILSGIIALVLTKKF